MGETDRIHGIGRAEHVERQGNASSTSQCLNDAIDDSLIPRKVLAEEFVGVSEGQFSKLMHSAAIDALGKLPDEVLMLFLERMGERRAFRVQVLAPVELDQELLKLLDQLTATLKLRKVRARPAKAGLSIEARRAAV